MNRKLRNVFFLLSLCFWGTLGGQTRWVETWYFGANAGVSFSTGSPVALTNSAMNMSEGVTTICDSVSGQILFYSNGLNVWNRNHLVMANGTGLMGGSSSSQSALAIPHPAGGNLYYLFTVDIGAVGLRYSIIDMNQNAGLGAVTATKNVLLGTGYCERMCAVRAGNCKDVWVLVKQSNNASWTAFRVTPTGISAPVVSTTGNSNTMELGVMKFNPQGTRIAMRRSFNPDYVVVASFNNTTGVVSNAYEVNTAPQFDNYGVSFSPNGNILYVAAYNGRTIYQYDLLAGTPASVQASRYLVATPTDAPCDMQIGPNGRIYVTRVGSANLSHISSPNTLGVGCGWLQNAVSLSGRVCNLGLPNFDQMYCAFPALCNTTVLPVAWNYFQAEGLPDATVALSWDAAGGADLHHFLAQRSSDGVNWEIISGEIPLSARQPDGFHLQDKTVTEGHWYYRIRSVERDGSHSYSETQEVNVHLGAALAVFPNPAQAEGGLNLRLVGLPSDGAVIQLFTAEGKLVWKQTLGHETEVRVPSGTLAPGVYLAKALVEGQTYVQRITVQ